MSTSAMATADPVLQGFDLHIGAGERVAIVGPSGSGKSTVAMLVSRFYDPTEGAVLVDGHDVRDVTLRLAAPPGRRGVRGELPVLRLGARQHRLRAARRHRRARSRRRPRAAQAHEFIERLPRGYDTVVGERGLTPLRRPAPAHRPGPGDPVRPADPDPRRRDQRHRRQDRGGRSTTRCARSWPSRTTLLIAHRRSTLHLADRIVVLEHGRVVEQGTHEELMARSALYRTLLSGLEEEDAEQDRRPDRGAGRHRVRAARTAPPRRPGPETAADRQRRTVGARSDRRAEHRRRPRRRWRRQLAAQPGADPRAAGPGGRAATGTRHPDGRPRHASRATTATSTCRGCWASSAGRCCSAWSWSSSTRWPRWPARSWSRPASTAACRRARRPCCSPLGHLPVVTLADLIDEVGETFVTGRAAQRIMLSLRIRIWAQLQRLSLDYYEREMAGRIMTRMTTDVDQFESLIENGLLSRAGLDRHLRRRRRRAGAHQRRARAVHAAGRRAAGHRHRGLPPPGRPALRPGPGADRDRQRRLPGEPVRRARVAGFRARGRDHDALPPARPRLPRVPGRRPAAGGDVLPVRAVPVRRSPTRSCSASAPA